MKRALTLSFCILSLALIMFMSACNSNKATIYKTWNFSRVYVSDTTKASPWLSAAATMVSGAMNGYKIQFNSDNTVKCSKDNTVISSGKIELQGDNSIKFALSDSAEAYKYELTDTSLNLLNGPIGMHFTAAK